MDEEGWLAATVLIAVDWDCGCETDDNDADDEGRIEESWLGNDFGKEDEEEDVMLSEKWLADGSEEKASDDTWSELLSVCFFAKN